jgi:hypothetical protein
MRSPQPHRSGGDTQQHFQSTVSVQKLKRFNSLILVFRFAAFCFSLASAVFMLTNSRGSDSLHWYNFDAFRYLPLYTYIYIYIYIYTSQNSLFFPLQSPIIYCKLLFGSSERKCKESNGCFSKFENYGFNSIFFLFFKLYLPALCLFQKFTDKV